jgi:hypothetical protein
VVRDKKDKTVEVFVRIDKLIVSVIKNEAVDVNTCQ